MSPIQLSRIVAMGDPRSVLAAVESTLYTISPTFDNTQLEEIFLETVDLYNGKHPGYRACNTAYHDLQHMTDVFLASARLIHGAYVKGARFADHSIAIALYASILHDVGYIQEISDTQGTGAKYTDCHVERSVSFLVEYLSQRGFGREDVDSVSHMVRATDLCEKIDEIPFLDDELADLGKIIATADLVGQMADRTYLEKLLFLYREFREGEVQGFESEFDLLQKTVGFYDFIQHRLAVDLGGVNSFMRYHFEERWGIMEDPYLDGMARHIDYLKKVVEQHPEDYRDFLNRDGLVDRLHQLYESE
ncbi:MAG: hypothetical protein ACYTGH_04940 [Planctomycetota bacterium]|jgi:hypothetical protein